jgi:hypothetical protein
VSVSGANAADFALTNGCGASLAVGASCAVGVAFRPGAPGPRGASIDVATDEPGRPVVSAAVSGTGISVTLTASLPSPQVVGTEVVFTATPVGSSEFELRFELWQGNTKIATQAWSASRVFTISAEQAAGTYGVQVFVRTSRLVSYDARALVPFIVLPTPAAAVTLKADAPSPHVTGTPVTFTATAIGSSGYEYRFELWQGNAKLAAQGWSSNETWVMPAEQAPGTYAVQVFVRTSRLVSYDARALVSYVVMPLPATSVTLAPSAQSPHVAGTPVTFTALATGSSGYEYRFELWQGSSTVATQAWSTSNIWTMPAEQLPAAYAVQVFVRTSSLVSYDARALIKYQVTAR